MGGAFTAVADDASALYWNPAGQATGDYVSLVVERDGFDAVPDSADPAAASRGNSTLVAFTLPVIGIGYYRETRAWAGPEQMVRAPGLRPSWTREGGSLIADHFVVSLAQTLVEGLHVAVALKAVRGRVGVGAVTGAAEVPDPAREPGRVLDVLSSGRGSADTTIDADAGVMLDARRWRVGVAARNLRQPEFRAAAVAPVALDRSVRMGVAVLATDRVTVAIDADLTTAERADGRWRAVAGGAEAWSPARRYAVRGGVRLQTVDQARAVGTMGVSAQVWKLLYADVHGAVGAGGRREWSLGARVAY